LPVPEKGEVLVEVRGAGIDPGETSIRTGALHDRFPATFPSGEGSDLSWEVAGSLYIVGCTAYAAVRPCTARKLGFVV
jgi:NADPH:quinone reductase-like Zn-dependent oxidoreductase